ncbi:hypothetical protein BX666DRAFT_764605 [Dichotomocladium elegans]|nr:hypothetical protein BX666DRAFT_764605 [Dichotomocladium elegans]
MLHFFYMVRLAQKGFFSLVPDMFAGIEMEAIVYFCDRLVGSSLFLAPNNNPEQQVFNLLRKLHDGVDEPVGPNYTTTYSQIRHAVQHAIKASLNPPLHPSEQQSVNTLQPPVWVVVPFNSMIDLPQQQQCFQQQAQSSVAAFSTPINTSKVKAVDPKYPAKTTAGTHPPQPPAQVVDSNNPSPVLSAAAKENHEDPRQNESVPDDHSHHDESVHGNMHHHTESTEEEHSSHNETTEGTCQHPNESGEGADGEPSRQTESLDGENDQDTGECFEGESGGRGARGRGSRGRGYRRGRGRGRGTYSPRGSGGRGRGSSRGIGSGKSKCSA